MRPDNVRDSIVLIVAAPDPSAVAVPNTEALLKSSFSPLQAPLLIVVVPDLNE